MAALLLIVSRAVLAQETTPEFVLDINPDSASSSISNPVAVGSTLFFTADDGEHGQELWKSDGTAEGTALVLDINTEEATGSDPAELIAYNGMLFFTADDGENGRELWCSDGTAAGTALVLDIRADASASPLHLTEYNGLLFFSADDGEHGRELWRSDGTEAGTSMVADLHPKYGCYAQELTEYNGLLYFSADGSTYGQELWCTDGTEAGTTLVKDVYPGGHSSPQYLTVANGLLFFTAVESTYGQELWCSDGTEAGTNLVKDIRTDGNSYPMFFAAANDLVFFSADDGEHGRELWQSDGSEEGTHLARDIAPGSAGAFPKNMLGGEEAVFFSADDGENGRELWRSDGTEEGTCLVSDIRAIGASNPQYFTIGNGFLYFQASEAAHGRELWTSTGTLFGTELVMDFNEGSGDGAPAALCLAGDLLFFSADDGTHGSELWVYDIPERDTTPPVIVLTGDDPIIIEQYTVYTDPGATAYDDFDGEVTESIIVNVLVDSSVAGDHSVTYDVSDGSGNAADQVTRTVRVLPSTPPVITLNGASVMSIEMGGEYTELGAAATDNVDGDVSDQIIASGTVNTSVPGAYTITYNVSDAAGNAATPVVRTINVIDNVPPVISLVGSSPTLLEQFSTYTDAGATATDNWDGDISANIIVSNPVNPAVAGAYTVTYNVSDSSSNAATQVSRAVHVIPAEAPVITLNGSASVEVVHGGTYVELGATAIDNVDGNLSDSIIITGTVDTAVVGDYTLAYDVADAAGNAAVTALRTVRVVDATVPVITLLGNAVVMTEAGAAYVDAGATAYDNHDGDISGNIAVNNMVNSAVAGTYSVTYDVVDSAGNAALRVTRIVNVLPAAAPVITLIGDSELSIEVGVSFEDPGATATDNADGNISDRITTYSTVDPFTLGDYFIAYNVTDTAGHAAEQVVRTVHVVDTTPPVITLLGEAVVSVELNEAFADPGATALDNADGDISANIVRTGTVDSSTAGLYVLTYAVSDTAGNAAEQVVRQVVVAVPPPVTWYVDASFAGTGDGSVGAPFTTINEALAAAQLGRNNIIRVKPGLYTETLALPLYTTLIGTGGANNSWIEAPEGTSGPLITLSANCEVRGFTLTGAASSAAVAVAAADTEVANCVLFGNQTGLRAASGAGVRFRNNTVSGNTAYGVRVDAGASLSGPRNSIFAGNGTGLSTSGAVTDGGYNCYANNGSHLQGIAAFSGDFVENPRFADAAIQNFHLAMDSPCRDAGTPDEDSLDADGSRNDIGADGGPDGVTDNLVPQAVASATPEEGPAPLEVTLDGSASTDEWGIASYSWDFDDSDGIQEDSADAVVDHTYATTGVYIATLTVTDHSGFSRQTTVTITVGNGVPVGTASRWPLAGRAPLTVEFSAQATDPDGGTVLYLWDFDGDGIADSPERSPRYTYPEDTLPGNYAVTLRLIDDEGEEALLSVPVTITEGLPDAADEIDAAMGGTVEVENAGSPLAGAQAILPAGALASKTVVTMGNPVVSFEETGRVVLSSVDIGPADTALSGSARLVLPHTAFGNLATLAIRFYDGAAKSWQPANVSNIETTADWTAFDITRFGTYAVVAGISPIDVNSDGAVNALDIQLVINAVLGISPSDSCDVNGDGSVNAIDMQLVINTTLGL